ncbi:hypothetical protein BJ138DRAFT_1149877 [Hygrophoropsis aurantiaca]|uniref:Uncharacterized protein n=1 Tax=Hygrophoropsis aurantiaca TaxID=72124 RepID=A0ACB8AF14_9AGAM|nr:hypothetical protein BJ138DRAFT_1149877 [Hygrophoropsis aurantiaca]
MLDTLGLMVVYLCHNILLVTLCSSTLDLKMWLKTSHTLHLPYTLGLLFVSQFSSSTPNKQQKSPGSSSSGSVFGPLRTSLAWST